MRMIIPEKIIELSNLFIKSNFKLYLVGGCVRDAIMGLDPHDWDVCTDASPEEIIALLEANNIGHFDTGIKHGTVTAIMGDNYEITTFRSESTYSDGRHPDNVKFIKDVNQDLARRDLTINAIAYDITTKEIVDPFNGRSDIENGIIRCVNDANERMSEDALRILRALRFSIKYGFSIEENTKKAMIFNKELLKKISKERITDELRKTLETKNSILDKFMEYHEIIFTIIPELECTYKFDQKNKYHQHDVYEHCLAVCDICKDSSFIVRLAALLHDIGKPSTFVFVDDGTREPHGSFHRHPKASAEITEEILKKDIRLSNNEANLLLELIRYHDTIINPDIKHLKKFYIKHGDLFMNDWLELKTADVEDHIVPEEEKLVWFNKSLILEQLEEIKNTPIPFNVKDLEIDGNDVMAFKNIKPGKEVGKILLDIHTLVLEGKVENNRDALLELIK